MYVENHGPKYHNRDDLFEVEMQPWDYHRVLLDPYMPAQSLGEAN